MKEKNKCKVYESTPSKRSNFKRFCRNNKLNFNDFEEVESDLNYGSHKRYFYVHKSTHSKQKDVVVEEVEKKVGYTKINDGYKIHHSDGAFEITKDILREIKRLYCISKLTMNGVARRMGISRKEFYAIKSAFSITKDDVPFIEEDVSNMSVEEMITQTNEEKKKLYDRELENAQYKDMSKRLKKFEEKNYFLNKIINDVKESIVEVTPKHKWNQIKPKTTGFHGVIQLSDIHYGELVDLDTNSYNMNMADNRINKMFSYSTRRFMTSGVKDVHVLFTGDLSNLSMIHDDKKSSEEVSRAKAMTRLYQTLASQIEGLLNNGLNVYIGGVVGNESRLSDKFSNLDEQACDNYDYILFQWLKARFGSSIRYHNECDKLHDVITVNGRNILLTHGDKVNPKDPRASIAKLKQMYSDVDYVLFGHIHSTMITDEFARSSSVVGANSYSQNKLLISDSKAAQNCGYVGKNEITFISTKLN